MVYTRKTRLSRLPAEHLHQLTRSLTVAPETRGWRPLISHLQLNMAEARMCEVGGGAEAVVDLILQRGWSVGKLLDALSKIGNEAAATDIAALVSAGPETKPITISGQRELQSGETLQLRVNAPPSYTDIQWYHEKECLPAEKSCELSIPNVSEASEGRYSVRLESTRGVVKWNHCDVSVSSGVETLRFVLQPVDCAINETTSTAHFFVDVRPHLAQLQWYCEGVLMHGKTEPYLAISNLDQNAHRRQYSCVASYGVESVESVKALIRWSPVRPGPHLNEGGGSVESATDKVALVIGNQTYTAPAFGDIVHAEDDARDISEALRALNFKVVSLINLSRVEMLAAFDNFYKLLSNGVYGVFYFAGHGFESGGVNYLVPVDAPPVVRVSDCLRAQHLLYRMQFRGTKLNLLLLDMCREFPGGQVMSCEVRPVPTLGNTAIGFACGPGSRAYGSESDRNGIYVKYLKEHITSNITVTKLLDTVNREIGLNEPTGYQRPHYQSSIIADICLTDRIDTTGHTVEFHHRSLLWAMANSLDRDGEDLRLQKATLRLSYLAPFSNVLLCSVDPAPNTIILDHDSELSGLELDQLSPTEYEIRHIQRMEQPFIELTVIYGCDSGAVRIERPLFAKITANRAAFGMDLHLSGGGSKAGPCEAPNLVTRACPGNTPTVENKKLEKDEEKGQEECNGEEEKATEVQDFEKVSRLPEYISDYCPELVYPFVGVYLFPRRGQPPIEIAASVERSLAKETGSQIAVTPLTHPAPCVEVVLRDADYGQSTESLLEGKKWGPGSHLLSLNSACLLSDIQDLARTLEVQEMWMSDGPVFKQVFPSAGLEMDVNPASLHVA